MTDNWDAYFCEVEGRPASILADLGMVEQAPLPGFPCVGYVAVELKEPDEHGFARRDEYECLTAFEDALVDGLDARWGVAPEEVATPDGECALVYVGRCISAGRCEFFFYIPSVDRWESRVRGALGPLPAYPWDAGAHEDPDWGLYLDFLYPSEPDLLLMQNHRLRVRLQEQGDDTSKERLIEHQAEFARREDRAAFCTAAQTLGFTLTLDDGPAQTDETETIFRAVLRRADSPENIDEVTFSLAELAEEHQGVYVGWSAPVTV